MTASIANAEELQHSSILGLGVYRPERVVTNDEICRQIDSTDEWIRVRSGIRNRRFAGPDETVIDMATAAGRDALRASQVSADQIGCERASEFVDLTDKSTAFIFADGAGAVVVGASPQAGMGPVEWGSDGSLAHVLAQELSWTEFRDNPTGPHPWVKFNGPAVFRWATVEMEKIARAALDRAGVTVEQLDAFIPHQANLRITEAISKRLKLLPSTVVARDIVDAGNTSAASVPLAVETLLRTGRAHAGDTALLMGFGAGLTYAAQVVTLPAAPDDP
ncbi:3-oxoacyl-[acyl-carrier-protein] synthase III C-terminal domain-containing protein [Rhodococcus wratislaviensis]|uniref:3-oxoacyl-[acyl-carrier-protein] synthase III C-terminal domain-containing protein n=1 Tax=Rhodococcus wratislaviensis TaxID=44752 RepID=UPI0036531952